MRRVAAANVLRMSAHGAEFLKAGGAHAFACHRYQCAAVFGAEIRPNSCVRWRKKPGKASLGSATMADASGLPRSSISTLSFEGKGNGSQTIDTENPRSTPSSRATRRARLPRSTCTRLEQRWPAGLHEHPRHRVRSRRTARCPPVTDRKRVTARERALLGRERKPNGIVERMRTHPKILATARSIADEQCCTCCCPPPPNALSSRLPQCHRRKVHWHLQRDINVVRK